MLQIKEDRIRGGWHTARWTRERRKKELEYESVPRRTGRLIQGKKSIETSCAIGEVFSAAWPRTGVQSLAKSHTLTSALCPAATRSRTAYKASRRDYAIFET